MMAKLSSSEVIDTMAIFALAAVFILPVVFAFICCRVCKRRQSFDESGE